jgi:trimeric autotransporter adhesin
MKTTLPEYFIRVVNRKFLSCLPLMVTLLLSLTTTAQVTTGKSYANITRPNGGTFAPGDEIEVRATIAVSGGSAGTPAITQVRYNDTINLNKFDYIAGSLKLISNEGRTQATYTDANGDDRAMINTVATPGLGYIRFVIGNGSTTSSYAQGNGIGNTGSLWGALFPTFYGGTCIQVFAYRIRIKNTPTVVSYDTTLSLRAGNFRYTQSASTRTTAFPLYQIKVTRDNGLCSNAIGTNALVSESGGTFGSGRNKNRTTASALVPLPYTMRIFSNSTPNDNFYGIANNTSGTWSTNPNLPYPDARRVFNVWEITGDHTGATNPTLGNPPADTTNPATNAGYALVINASYETNKAFEQTITNLCEDTYYEFSAWFKNVCRRCSCDSSGRGALQSGFVPGPGNDSAGVKPNLTFQIDGIDYYTTGNIPFTQTWVKKGFIYRTRPGQTSFTITIRNNAPGGGGNDWAIDDIGVATCSPNMRYSPSLTPNVCTGNAFTIYDTVRSFFDNYVYYQWQKSTDGGTIWTDVGAPVGPVVPYASGTEWEYVSSYTVPPTETLPANTGDKYRLVVATSVPNLSNVNCRSTDIANAVTLNVIICGPVLTVDLISFNGNIVNNRSALRWTTSGESEPMLFDIERSYNGSDFTIIATINNDNDYTNGFDSYSFTDPDELTGKAYYRIRMRSLDGKVGYSRILQLSGDTKGFNFVSVVNPFNNTLYFDLSSARAGTVVAELLDQFGRPVRRKILEIREGNNQFFFESTSSLAPGIYFLKAEMEGAVIHRKVLKQNQ